MSENTPPDVSRDPAALINFVRVRPGRLPAVMGWLADALERVLTERDGLASILAAAPHERPCRGPGHSGWPNYLPVKCTCWKSKLPAVDLAARDARMRGAGLRAFAEHVERERAGGRRPPMATRLRLAAEREEAKR